MDSSRTDFVEEFVIGRDSFSPWQVGRLRDRLANYKSSVRLGWERIALDILDDGDQDEDYVDAEDVRPFSESLRRLVAGSQIPTDERLNAIRIYLRNIGYLSPGDLDEARGSLQTPAAFMEFVAGGDANAKKAVEALKVYEGTYSQIQEGGPLSENQYFHQCLSLDHSGGVMAARLTDSRLNRIDTLRRLKNDPKVRKRALQAEFVQNGFLAGLPDGRFLVILRPAVYDEFYRSKVLLLWAVPEGNDQAASVSSILLMDYPWVSKVKDINEAKEKLADPGELVILSPKRPDFFIFDRD
ncbi:hypothetical protein TH25_21170 [Thalassospira profundimaris]|uniref:Uncharacterized protein n=1 Tax=Thalassospira profundimaris TaxID=502049 RepID=A0A367WQE4_9PROT|nr:hypothetical protein [Thalassospira profundimaris]RCK43663.1 hypothetical protein TH25_21170 [Thalassospira profundimaris]